MAALMTIRTISAIYSFLPVEVSSRTKTSKHPLLNATQIIALHLCLNRPVGEADSNDSHYGPYISLLPRSFDEHPLTWLARQRHGVSKHSEDELLRWLPPSVHTELDGVVKNFTGDWERVVKCVVGDPTAYPLPESITFDRAVSKSKYRNHSILRISYGDGLPVRDTTCSF